MKLWHTLNFLGVTCNTPLTALSPIAGLIDARGYAALYPSLNHGQS